jgi:hypothetical protein
MLWSRLIGALFLAGFLTYGSGSLLVESILGEPDFVSTIPERETLLVFGAVLMLLNTGVDVGKGVLFFPILEGHGKRTALVYLAALIVQVAFLAVGVLFLLLLVPLGGLVEAGNATPEWAAGVGTLLSEANTIAYNIGQAVLSFGGFFLCLLLFRTGLVPRALAALGVAGYVLHAAGSIAELFGIPIGLFLLIPGAIFELGLAFWLLVKGFRPEAYARGFRLPPVEQR